MKEIVKFLTPQVNPEWEKELNDVAGFSRDIQPAPPAIMISREEMCGFQERAGTYFSKLLTTLTHKVFMNANSDNISRDEFHCIKPGDKLILMDGYEYTATSGYFRKPGEERCPSQVAVTPMPNWQSDNCVLRIAIKRVVPS